MRRQGELALGESDRARLLRIEQGDQPALFVKVQQAMAHTIHQHPIQEPAILPKSQPNSAVRPTEESPDQLEQNARA